MKKKIIKGILLFFVIGIIYLIFNWKPILLGLSGFQSPLIENEETVSAWIEDKSDGDEWVAIANSKESYNVLQTDFGMPGIMIFDKRGKSIVSSVGEGCQVIAREKLKTLKPNDQIEAQYSTNSIRYLNDLKKYLELLQHNWKDENAAIAEADYVAVYTWAKCFPNRSEEMIAAVKEGLKESDAKILVISVNLDLIDSWMEGDVGDKIEFEL